MLVYIVGKNSSETIDYDGDTIDYMVGIKKKFQDVGMHTSYSQ